MRIRVSIATVGLLLLSRVALAGGRGHLTPPPEELYYADACADHYQIPRALVHAIITQESGWNPHALSNKNAMGLMQLMPDTVARYGVQDPWSSADNACGGAHYLADLIHQFGDYREVIAAYYCGEHHIQARGLQYANPAVTAYVLSVRNHYLHELAAEGFDVDESEHSHHSRKEGDSADTVNSAGSRYTR